MLPFFWGTVKGCYTGWSKKKKTYNDVTVCYNIYHLYLHVNTSVVNTSVVNTSVVTIFKLTLQQLVHQLQSLKIDTQSTSYYSAVRCSSIPYLLLIARSSSMPYLLLIASIVHHLLQIASKYLSTTDSKYLSIPCADTPIYC